MFVRGRRCRRCGGNLTLEHDEDGKYLSCLQCGGTERKFTGTNTLNSRSPVIAWDIKEKEAEAAPGNSRVKLHTG